MRPAIIILAAMAIIAAIAAASLAGPAAPDPGIGLVVNSPSRTVSLSQIDGLYSEAASAGAGRSNAYMFWSIVEPSPGEYDWSSYDPLLEAAKRNGLHTTLFFSIVNGETLGPFPGWMGDPDIESLDPGMLSGVLGAALSRYDTIDTVIISGQTESMFRHGGTAEYAALFTEVYDTIKKEHPDIMMGNSFALHHILNKNLEHVVEELPAGDFVAFSYWPVDALNEIIKTPQEAAGDLGRMLDLAPGMTALFEVGWSTSEFVGGDEESQAEFVGIVHDFYGQNRDRVGFVTWFKQHDMPDGTCASAQNEIGGSRVDLTGTGLGGTEHVIERLDRFVCNAGLVRVDGTAKPAWTEFAP